MPSTQPEDVRDLSALITVVMATRNRPEGAAATVARLLALPERPGVLVVADGCERGTAATIAGRFPSVRLLEVEERRGVAAARNLGVASAPTPYVVFCDDDSWWAPGAMAAFATTLDAHPRVGLVAGQILVGEDRRPDPTCLRMAASPLAAPGLPGPRVLGFIACGAAVRRRAYLEVGGFPEEYVIGGEEEPLALALAAVGWDAVYLEEAVAFHRPLSVSRDPAGRERRVARNDLWTAWQWRAPGGALRQTLRILAGANTPAKRNGVRDALRGLPRVLRARSPVPSWVESDRRALEIVPGRGRQLIER